MVYGGRKSNSCSWKAVLLVRGLEGGSLKVLDIPLGMDKFSVNPILGKYFLYFHRARDPRFRASVSTLSLYSHSHPWYPPKTWVP